jgi:hypothetical protein
MFGRCARSSLSLAPRRRRAAGRRPSPIPVLDADFPDPAVLKAPDGYLLRLCDADRAGRAQDQRPGRPLARPGALAVARRRAAGEARLGEPTWNFWAPHVVRHGGRYFLYYSAEPDPPDRAEDRPLPRRRHLDRPEGPFTDSGHPLQCGPGFVNIDPMAFDDPATGKRLLYWGSGFQPIKVRELAPDRLSFAPGQRRRRPRAAAKGRRLSGAGRRRLGRSPRRLLLPLLFGQQLLREGRALCGDGRPLAPRHRPVREGAERRSSSPAAAGSPPVTTASPPTAPGATGSSTTRSTRGGRASRSTRAGSC